MISIIKKENRNFWMGVAIIMIILCHIQCVCYNNGFIMQIMHILFKKGEFGVDIFIFLSIIGLSHSYESNSTKRFYANRIKRLFPIYFVFLGISFCYSKPINNILKDVIFQITGFTNFTGNRFNEWYIPAIILIYALFPLLHKATLFLFRINKWYIIFITLFIIYLTPTTCNFITTYFARRLYIIPLGIITYELSKSNNKENINDMLLIIACCQLFVPTSFNLYLCIPFFLIQFDKHIHENTIHKIISWIGMHSLEIYLGQTIGIIDYCSLSTLGNLYRIPIGILITIILAIIMFHIHKSFYYILKLLSTKNC